MDRINGKTKLISLIGSPVEHSKSPNMHNLSFASLDLDYIYMAFDVKEDLLKQTVEALQVLDSRGFNITMPYKEEVIKYLDEVKEDAKLIGAVNTVVNDKGKLIGYNTDGKGFIEALDVRGVKYNGEKIAIIGAGGAAKAIAIELALKGAREILIINRTIEKAQEICDIINKNIKSSKARCVKLDERLMNKEISDASILVNTTSIGMANTRYKSIINDNDTFHRDLFVADLIYDPIKTRFLAMAESMGAKTMNGLGMLAYQGALAFKLWTGQDMPKDIIEKIEKRSLFG